MRGLLANRQKHILGLLAIFLFALMGAYVVFRSKALESGPSIFFFIASGTYNETHQPGETFMVPILARGTVTAPQADNQVQLNISYDSTRVRYVKSVCSTQI